MDFRGWLENSGDVYPTFEFDYKYCRVRAQLQGRPYEFDKGSPYIYQRWEKALAKDPTPNTNWKIWHILNGTKQEPEPQPPPKPRPLKQKAFW